MVQANHTTVVRWVRPKIFGFGMVSCFQKQNVGIRELSPIVTESLHTTTRVVYVIGYTKVYPNLEDSTIPATILYGTLGRSIPHSTRCVLIRIHDIWARCVLIRIHDIRARCELIRIHDIRARCILIRIHNIQARCVLIHPWYMSKMRTYTHPRYSSEIHTSTHIYIWTKIPRLKKKDTDAGRSRYLHWP